MGNLFKVNNKTTMTTTTRRQRCYSAVFTVNFEQISHIVFMLLLLPLENGLVVRAVNLDQTRFRNYKFTTLYQTNTSTLKNCCNNWPKRLVVEHKFNLEISLLSHVKIIKFNLIKRRIQPLMLFLLPWKSTCLTTFLTLESQSCVCY